MKTETANAPVRKLMETEEARRLAEIAGGRNWRRWGPYLADRQWGVVREDYSANGDAWGAFPFEQSGSRAYRWGEDGIGGFSDERQRLCVSLALWNGVDPFLKERLFGLTNPQGNHGEDVKELYYHLDGAPSHAYMKMLYKYPQSAFPYARLREENARRGLNEREFEIVDTGVFDDSRYFDVEIEYAKADPEDVLLRVSATNRGPETATLWLLPQIWFRNRWSWSPLDRRPELRFENGRIGVYQSDDLDREFAWDYYGTPLFCDNDTNFHKLWDGHNGGFCKDGINDFVVDGDRAAVNPAGRGSKAAVMTQATLAPGATTTLRLRLRPCASGEPFADFNAIVTQRIVETDAFYAALQDDVADADARRVQRQAYAGMLWSKQFYGYDVRRWLNGDPLQSPPPEARREGRNSNWRHFASGDVNAGQAGDVLSMPDAWEYPWFAAWDLAFHCIVLANVDPAFAKSQLTDPHTIAFSAPQRSIACLRMELRRRQSARSTPGRRCKFTMLDQPRRRAWATAHFWSASFTSCCSTSHGGSTARTPAGATSFRAGSSASTTSACSTCANRCRSAGGSINPTARPGWPRMRWR